jgi:hypothetical protein
MLIRCCVVTPTPYAANLLGCCLKNHSVWHTQVGRRNTGRMMMTV